MGYRPKAKVYNLTFDDHPGLEVKARSVDTATFMEIAALADRPGDPGTDELDILYVKFADVLVSWNLEYFDEHPKAGEPVPTTLDGLLSQDFDFVQEIILGWMEAVGGVAAPLDQRSTDGSLSLVESLPMEPLSANRAS